MGRSSISTRPTIKRDASHSYVSADLAYEFIFVTTCHAVALIYIATLMGIWKPDRRVESLWRSPEPQQSNCGRHVWQQIARDRFDPPRAHYTGPTGLDNKKFRTFRVCRLETRPTCFSSSSASHCWLWMIKRGSYSRFYSLLYPSHRCMYINIGTASPFPVGPPKTLHSSVHKGIYRDKLVPKRPCRTTEKPGYISI